MAVVIALPGFNGFGLSVTPIFLSRTADFIHNDLHVVQKCAKNQCGKLKKIQDFCPRDMEIYHLAAARHVKLWSLNANFSLRNLTN